MNNKNTSLIATVVAAVLCGCPGLIGLCFGATSVLASLMPNANVDVFGSNNPASGVGMGLVFLCLSVISLAIPVVVWFVTKPKNQVSSSGGPGMDEPMPPAS